MPCLQFAGQILRGACHACQRSSMSSMPLLGDVQHMVFEAKVESLVSLKNMYQDVTESVA
eukprot:6321339-Amphidinium_carterae.1